MTERENQVLQLILKGKTNKEICFDLGISAGTVKTHLRSLFKEFDAESRLELALKAIEKGRQPMVTRRVIMGVQV
jgi:DNA-binding NarL/FixJ family response regulator